MFGLCPQVGGAEGHGVKRLRPLALALLAALLTGEWGVADASDPRHRREASGVVAAYLQWHLERGLRSLRLVERT